MPGEARRIFFDSNALLYLISEDTRKASLSHAYLMTGGTVSVQVLNEFVNVARRKHRLPISDIRMILGDFLRVLSVVPVTMPIHLLGLDLIDRHNFSTYDAMIVSAALEAGCDLLLSEDMQRGMVVNGTLRIENPFLT